MQRWKDILFNILLSLNCVLALFVLAGSRLQVPLWLQVAGRMHLVLLHFPIVLVILYIVWSVLVQSRAKQPLAGPEDWIGQWLLLAAAGTAALTALMGFLLSNEEGYDPQAIWWHKWGGVAVSLLLFGWYAYRNWIHRRRYLPQLAALLSFVLIVFTGHQGSNITRGEDYLLAPVSSQKLKPVVPITDAVVFTDMVKPVLEAKCMSCHSSRKAKGGLVMETEKGLLAGGKHGALWTAGQPAASLLVQRLRLPEGEKKHMPPIGKPQLDREETAILFQWIRSGASFQQKVVELPPADTLRTLANNLFEKGVEEDYDFSAASDGDIKKLNNTNRLIHPIALGSPALAVNFYNRQNYSSAALKDLLALKTQIISLDMAYMPLKGEDIATLAQFHNLRKLNLNFSAVPGAELAALDKLPSLNHLSLSGTSLCKKDVEALTKIPALRSLYLWNVPVAAADINALRKAHPGIRFETGYMNDTVVLKLTPPILETEERIINVKPLALSLKHYIKGVSIRYTLDGSSPDSTSSPVYKEGLQLDKTLVFKARAFKTGWEGSDTLVMNFFKNGFRADSIRSLTPLDSVYKGSDGAAVLVDAEKGDFNRKNGKWLGFRRNPMEMLLCYGKPVLVSSVSLSTLVEVGGAVMPPAAVEIWGGNSKEKLSRLARIVPPQPDSVRGGYMHLYDCNFTPVQVQFLKVIAVPVSKLPAWHPGKGKPGWVFTDEILVN
ncbi:MAG: chitobiase/beta-hexosaminidase C-terminal domain-containing protein [Williamsia sp.]|nr:chitobiase/beta-hexosaminidase C-terminal domain-containing protein [Williamsia sp.]